jgi:predicted ribosome quality control (RQC) complex YloA/Tae2 family protein
MFYDALTMACVADELRQTILHGRVQQVLLLLTSEKLRRGVDKDTSLLQLLRKYARGAIVSAIRQPPFERIVRLELDHPEWGCSELIVEVMGRHSNVMLVDAGGRVLDAVKRVGPHLSPTRPILPGQDYTPPPPQSKLPPSALTEHRLREILGAHEAQTQVWRALVAGLRGTSPLLAREISFRALGQPRATIAQVERLTPLLDTVRELLSPLSDGRWQPTVVLEGGQPVVYAPYPLTHRGEPQPMPTVCEAIEITIAAAGSADPYAGAKRALREAIASARARTERRQNALQVSMRQVAEIEQLRERGEWILSYAHTIEPGQKELVAETHDGEVRIIPLDPAKSAVENAQAYFARYRKAQRAAEGGPARLEVVNLALRDLEQLETDLDLAANRPEIDEVRAALVEAGHLKAKRGKVPKSGRSQPLSLTIAGGFRILVGRNSRQNDEVTFRRAKSDDWWFHARGVPGSHVIVFPEGRKLPPETIRQAAELAAYFSRSRAETKVLVDYTRRRYVRRIPRAAPGLVTYRREQSIRVEPRGPAPVDSGGNDDP